MLFRLEKLSKVKLTGRFHSLLEQSSSAEGIQLMKVDIKNVSCGVKQLPLMSLSEVNLFYIFNLLFFSLISISRESYCCSKPKWSRRVAPKQNASINSPTKDSSKVLIFAFILLFPSS